jgi:hypothetical protein
MGFSTNAFAKIKEVADKGNYSVVKLTITKKDKVTGNFICTFSGSVTFVGQAHLCRPLANQKIKITSCDVNNGYADSTGEQKWNTHPQFVVYKYELQDGNTTPNTNYNTNAPQYAPNFAPPMDFAELDDDSDLPF